MELYRCEEETALSKLWRRACWPLERALATEDLLVDLAWSGLGWFDAFRVEVEEAGDAEGETARGEGSALTLLVAGRRMSSMMTVAMTLD